MRVAQSVLRKFIGLANMRVTQTIPSKTMKNPLRRARELAGKTIVEVGRSVGVDPGNLSRIENGKQKASTELAEKLAKYFDGGITEIEILYPERFNVSPAASTRALTH